MENLNNKAIIYTRISSSAHGTFCPSQKEQTDLCQSYADEHELKVLDVYSDYGQSGLDIERPALRELAQMVVAEANVTILLSSADRLANNGLLSANLQYAFEILGAKVVDVSHAAYQARRAS